MNPDATAMAKYPWGDNAFDDRVFGASLLYTGILFTVFLKFVIPEDGLPAIDSGMALHPPLTKKGMPTGGGVAGTIVATLAWTWIYWNSMAIQVYTRMFKQNHSDGATYLTGRIMGNTLEHAIVFLPLMWLHCAYINATEAHYLGLFYVANRVLYQIVYAYFGGFTYAMEFTTGPSMAAIYYFFNSLLCKALLDKNWVDILPANPLFLVPTIILQSLTFFMLVWGLPTGHFVSGLVDKALPAKRK